MQPARLCSPVKVADEGRSGEMGGCNLIIDKANCDERFPHTPHLAKIWFVYQPITQMYSLHRSKTTGH